MQKSIQVEEERKSDMQAMQTENRHQGKIEELKSRLIREFGYGAPTVERIFSEVIGEVRTDRCVNCGANMLEQIFTFDCADALLLLEMGRVVHEARRSGKSFTEANKVHVPTLQTSHAIKCRTTQVSKLGLIAKYKVRKSDGTMVQMPGTWVITSRGWEALSGKPVVRTVTVWRGEIQERSDVVITLREALQTNAKRLSKTADARRGMIDGYDPREWAEYGNPHQGLLL